MSWDFVIHRIIRPLAVLNPRQRLGGARQPFSAPSAGAWLLVVSIAAIVLVVGGGVAGTILYSRSRRKRKWKAFDKCADQAGLAEEERDLLAYLAQRAGIRHPKMVFSSQQTFKRLRTNIGRLGKVSLIWGESQGGVCATCVHVKSLFEKLENLAQLPQEDGDEPQPIDLGPMAEGVTSATDSQDCSSVTEMVTLKINPVEIWRDKSLVVRYCKGDAMWRLSAWMTTTADGKVVIRPFGTARWVDRRRFERVSVNMPAQVACFPFETTGTSGLAREFVEAKVVEMAGVGLRMQASLPVCEGQRVLVALKVEGNRTVESLGVVHHILSEEAGVSEFAVELVGLKSSEVAELITAADAPVESAPQEAVTVAS